MGAANFRPNTASLTGAPAAIRSRPNSIGLRKASFLGKPAQPWMSDDPKRAGPTLWLFGGPTELAADCRPPVSELVPSRTGPELVGAKRARCKGEDKQVSRGLSTLSASRTAG